MTDTTPTSALPVVVPILSSANFIIGMGGFMVIGLLNPVAEAFSITAAQAGWLMIAYSVGYAILSPLLVSITGAIGRRRVLAAGLFVFFLANVLGATAQCPATLYAARFLAAGGAGIVTPLAAAVASGLSHPDRQARALASVMFGLTMAQVVGVPAGGFIAYTFGWRAAFWVVAVLTLPVIVLIWTRVPAGLSFVPVSLGDLGRIVIDPPAMLAVLHTTFFVGSSFVLYTYISPLLAESSGFGRDGITLVLLLFGLGAVVGNYLGGQVSDRIGPYRTLLLLALTQAVIMPFYSLLPIPFAALLFLSFCWSAFGWSFMPAQQVRLIAFDPRRASLMLSLNAAAIYVGSALGSTVGAWIISRFGVNALGIGGSCGALLAACFLSITERTIRRDVE